MIETATSAIIGGGNETIAGITTGEISDVVIMTEETIGDTTETIDIANQANRYH